VATTRAEDPNPGVMFNGERAHGLRFADIGVSIPPDVDFRGDLTRDFH